MPETLCRLVVHHAGRTVDLALPGDVGVGQLLPSIVDIVHGDTDPPADGGRWRLHHSGGYLVDEELTLHQNGVDDGDLVWLTTEEPPPIPWTQHDPCHVVADAAATGERTASVWVVVSLTAAVLGAGVLGWAAHTSDGASWSVCAAVSATAVGGALVLRRSPPAPLPSMGCSAIAVLFATVAGAIAAPAGPLTASLLLASAAACLVSTVLLRLNLHGATTLGTLATAGGLAAIVCMAGVLWALPPAAVGASLTALSLAALSAAPRFTMAISLIAPVGDDGAPPDVDERRAARAHTTLTGLVSGSSVTAAVGAALVTLGQITDRERALAAAAFTAVAGITLMLRARTHAVPARRSVLVISGVLCAAMAFVITVHAHPSVAHWLSMPAIAAAAAALIPTLGRNAGPTLHRLAEISEYAALAAVVPLGCWVTGVYRFARDAALL